MKDDLQLSFIPRVFTKCIVSQTLVAECLSFPQNYHLVLTAAYFVSADAPLLGWIVPEDVIVLSFQENGLLLGRLVDLATCFLEDAAVHY